ncbi:MAG: hypothetical protein JWQ98_2579 [Chlorobi bacterium]|nr:hypothetical protein [Chlorobiota bacterium]
MKSLLTFMLLLCCTVAGAQEIVWEKNFRPQASGASLGVDVMRTSDGGFLAVGESNNGAGPQATVYLVRTDSNGAALWNKLLAGHDSTFATALYPAADDGFYIVGSTQKGNMAGDSTLHPWIAKLDAGGAILWEKTRGNGRVNGATRTGDGGFVLTGMSDAEVLLMKLDSAGGLVWKHSFHRSAWATGASVRETSDGGYIIVGSTVSMPTPDANVLLIRTNSAGDSLWAGAYMEKFVSWDEGYCVEEVAGGFVFAGVERGNGATDRFDQLFMAGIGAQGEVRWYRSLPLYVRGTDSLGINDPHMSMRIDGGHVAISGASGPDNTMPFLMSVGSDGAIDWQKMLGGLIFSQSVASSFKPLSDGGFIVTGTTMGQLLLIRLSRPTTTSAVGEEESLPEKMNLSRIDPPTRNQ